MNMQWTRRGWALGALALGLSAMGAATVAGPAFPERTVRIVVPFTAGGSSDVQARMLADRLGRLAVALPQRGVIRRVARLLGGHQTGSLVPVARRKR